MVRGKEKRGLAVRNRTRKPNSGRNGGKKNYMVNQTRLGKECFLSGEKARERESHSDRSRKRGY